jgi:acetate kinase
MKILVINSGSSSLKYILYNMEGGAENVLAKGVIEKIGEKISFLKHKANDSETRREVQARNHEEAFAVVITALMGDGKAVIKSTDEVDAVGHRIVHGGEAFFESTLITEEVEKVVQDYCRLAPLHNPPNLVALRAAQKFFPRVPHVAVFDTAFHQTMPKVAYMYAIPYEFYEKYGIRRYGFHGTSHRFVALRAAQILGIPNDHLNCITAHLGNGVSLAAIRNGKSVDTTMGLTPLEGMVMGTRSGTIDPSIISFLIENAHMTLAEIDNMLNKKSGLLGISGVSNDVRDLWAAAEKGNERAMLALDMFAYSVRRFLGARMAVLDRVDAIIFTAGIGERDPRLREKICSGLEHLGIDFDAERNRNCIAREMEITKPGSRVKVLVVPTNEELMIARDTAEVARKAKGKP